MTTELNSKVNFKSLLVTLFYFQVLLKWKNMCDVYISLCIPILSHTTYLFGLITNLQDKSLLFKMLVLILSFSSAHIEKFLYIFEFP